MELENLLEKLKEIESRLDSLECRLEALEKVVSKGDISLSVEVPKVILEKSL